MRCFKKRCIFDDIYELADILGKPTRIENKIN
jgi:hypothetical protein